MTVVIVGVENKLRVAAIAHGAFSVVFSFFYMKAQTQRLSKARNIVRNNDGFVRRKQSAWSEAKRHSSTGRRNRTFRKVFRAVVDSLDH